MANDFLLYIISRLSTKANTTKGLNYIKTIPITQTIIDKYRRDNIMSLLKELESNKELGVEVAWKYVGVKPYDVQSFKIPMNTLSELCSMAGVSNKADELVSAHDLIQTLINRCCGTWLESYYCDLLKSISKGTIDKHLYDELFHTGLIALCKNSEPRYYRTFSQNAFHLCEIDSDVTHSKIFEKHKKSYASIIKKYHPCATNNMREQDLFELCNLYSYSQVFEYMGNMNIVLNNGIVIGDLVYTGMILNTKSLREAIDIQLSDSVKTIVTIENKDNYYSMEFNSDTLYIYVHGYLSPIEQNLCRLINDISQCREITIKHWGDMDYGGIRIYKYMKTIFPNIVPFKMFSEDYTSMLKKSNGYPIKENTRQLLEKMDAEELSELKDVILQYGICFEQEDQLLK